METVNGSPTDVIATIAVVIAFLFFGIAPLCGLTYVVYFFFTLPMRRRERARLFLYLLEMGLNEGRSAEAAIDGAASSGDLVLGSRFHSLSRYLRQGLRLGQALDHVSYLLPPRVVGMLKTGERIGDIRKVLPACRLLVRDGVSEVRGAANYLILVALAFTPFFVIVPILFRVKVMPSYEQVFAGMLETSRLPAFTRLIFGGSPVLTLIQLVILLGLWAAVFLYVGGPRLRQNISDLIGHRQLISPWNWRRMQRDFSAMLAVLLDSGVPEIEAVRLAAESTASPVMTYRAQKVCRNLEKGVLLPEALQELDKSGELQWRLTNVLRQGKGFLQALTGWHEALDARAFQLEQSAAQITTSGLVLLNGAIVASIIIAVFLALIQLLNEALLW